MLIGCKGMSWVFYLLARHPEWQGRLRQEIGDTLGDELPTFQNVQSIPLATMIVKEALRLCPPVSMIGRLTRRETKLGGYQIPANVRLSSRKCKGAHVLQTVVLSSVYNIHRNPRFWHDPLAFDPLRFAADDWQKSPTQFMPFGDGPARCIGERLAMLEMTTTLVLFARRMCWRLAERQPRDVVGINAVTLGPKNGMWLAFSPL